VNNYKKSISVLFTENGSIYYDLGLDCWDINRDAMLYDRNNTIIAHPPCRLFGRLFKFSTAPGCERLLGVFSVLMAQKYGGIVEQPAGSKLWKLCNISRSTKPDKYGGYVINVQQNWFGYACKKSTDLYIVGCPLKKLPEIPLNFNAIEYGINKTKFGLKEYSKKARSTTTYDFAKWLVEVATLCNTN
jgi:hypothetical protein